LVKRLPGARRGSPTPPRRADHDPAAPRRTRSEHLFLMERPRPARTFTVDTLTVEVFRTSEELGAAAAVDAAETILAAHDARGEVNLVVSTGNSQLTFFQALRSTPGLPWSRTRIFLADQYAGVDEAAFGTLAFLTKHLLAYVAPLQVFPAPSDPSDLERGCRAYEALLRRHPPDLATIGFGVNGHIAFNDPHNTAFDETRWVKPVELAPESRQQPVDEGRFPSLEAVPTHAVTMTLASLLAPPRVLCIVPEARKAEAVRKSLLDPIDATRPGSVLRTIGHARLYLDEESAARVSRPLA
jgi:glucosamine-6-phosphate deaminase